MCEGQCSNMVHDAHTILQSHVRNRSQTQVLYLTEAIDEVVFTNLATYDGKQLMDVSREGLEMDEEEGSKVRRLRFIISFPWPRSYYIHADVAEVGSWSMAVGVPGPCT